MVVLFAASGPYAPKGVLISTSLPGHCHLIAYQYANTALQSDQILALGWPGNEAKAWVHNITVDWPSILLILPQFHDN